MPTYDPTPEQGAAIDAFTARKHLVIQAGAGTGKTSTLRMLAESQPRRRGLYVAYVVAEILGITDWAQLGTDVPALAPQQIARIAMATVGRFSKSADQEIGAWHIPLTPRVDLPPARAALADLIVPLARQAWAELIQLQGQLKFSHDHYLKLWQMSYPRLPAEYVLFDEAQDADPVIMSIIGNQRDCQLVVVGDTAQAIYEWRGAINAMAKFPGDRLTLSRSFRFGPAVAEEANRWLDLLDAPLRLQGHDPIPSRVTDEDVEPDAILCRTNAGAMTAVMKSLAAGRRTALVGGGGEIRRLAAAAASLKAGAPCEHPELFAFQNWAEVQEYVDQDEGGSDLRTMVKLIDDYGPDALINAVDQLVDEPGRGLRLPMALTDPVPDVIVSTAHKAKGREWPIVEIGQDFYPPKRRDDGTLHEPDPAEVRLAYVATTRAKLVLHRGSLAWIDTYLRQLQAQLQLQNARPWQPQDTTEAIFGLGD